VEFNSFGPAVGRLGSDSSRGAKVEAGGLSPLPPPLTLTTGVPPVANDICRSAVPAPKYLPERRSTAFPHHNTPAPGRCDIPAFTYTFIIHSAGEIIFNIGEHLAKLQAKWLTVSNTQFALQFCPQRCRSRQIS